MSEAGSHHPPGSRAPSRSGSHHGSRASNGESMSSHQGSRAPSRSGSHHGSRASHGDRMSSHHGSHHPGANDEAVGGNDIGIRARSMHGRPRLPSRHHRHLPPLRERDETPHIRRREGRHRYPSYDPANDSDASPRRRRRHTYGRDIFNERISPSWRDYWAKGGKGGPEMGGGRPHRGPSAGRHEDDDGMTMYVGGGGYGLRRRAGMGRRGGWGHEEARDARMRAWRAGEDMRRSDVRREGGGCGVM